MLQSCEREEINPAGTLGKHEPNKKTGALLLRSEQHRRLLGRALGELTGEGLRRQNCQVKIPAAEEQLRNKNLNNENELE
jgi:hypothetical protein